MTLPQRPEPPPSRLIVEGVGNYNTRQSQQAYHKWKSLPWLLRLFVKAPESD